MWLIIPALLTIHVIICLLLVLVTLMQLPRSEGLGAAFGGAVTENMFGAQTTHVLAKFTVWLGMAFFVVTLALAVAYARKASGNNAVQRALMSSAPVTAPTASPAASPAAAPAASPASAPADSAVVTEPAPAASPAAAPVAEAVTEPVAAPTPAPSPATVP